MPGTASTAGRSAQLEFERRRSSWRRNQVRRFLLGLPLVLVLAGTLCWWIGWHTTSVPAAGYAAAGAVVLTWVTALVRTPQTTTAWRAGAEGERQTERLLRPLARRGATVLHDRALPRSRANLDHLIADRTGIYAVDSKNWRARGARVELDRRTGTLWYGRQAHNKTIATAQWEADRAAEVIGARLGRHLQVTAVICVHGAPVGRRGILLVDGVTILEARRLRRFLARQPRIWTQAEAATVAEAAASALPPK